MKNKGQSFAVELRFLILTFISIYGLPLVLTIVVSILMRSIRAGFGVALAIVFIVVSALSIVYLAFGVSSDVGILLLIPIVVYVLMMGLGNDYSVFILSRVKEEVDKGEENFIMKGLTMSAGTVTALGVILAFSFRALAITPIKSVHWDSNRFVCNYRHFHSEDFGLPSNFEVIDSKKERNSEINSIFISLYLLFRIKFL